MFPGYLRLAGNKTAYRINKGMIQPWWAPVNVAKLECVQKVKHLGMWFTPDMDNSKELIEKKENFIDQANHILTKYESPVKWKMIETYCCHFYGSEM